MFVRIKTVQHAFSAGCAAEALYQWGSVVLRHGRYGHIYKKHFTLTQCVKRRMCNGDSSFSCLSHSHYLTVCTAITNNSPYIEKWGVQSRPPHRKVCLFECYPQVDVKVLMLPTVDCFCLNVTHRKSFVWVLPTKSFFCFKVTHRNLNFES